MATLSVGDEVHVQLLGRDAAIEKDNEAAQRGIVGEVGLNELCPGISFGLGAAGIAIAGEVHEIQSIGLDAVEVNASGLAWGGAGFGEIFASDQGVNEAGFAHIGSPHHSQLREGRKLHLGWSKKSCLKGHKWLVHRKRWLTHCVRFGQEKQKYCNRPYCLVHERATTKIQGETMWMRKWLGVAVILSCAACARSNLTNPPDARPAFFSEMRYEEVASVHLRVTPQDVRGAVNLESEIWRRARETTIKQLAAQMLGRRLVVPLDTAAQKNQTAAVVTHLQDGNLMPAEEATGDVVQDFRGSLVVDLKQMPPGRVSGLETSGYMAGSLQRVYVLLPVRPMALPAYVTILKPQKVGGDNFYRVIAIGEIVELMDMVDSQGVSAALGNVEIVMADRETEVGDAAVLAMTSLTALAESPRSAENASPEVTVRPRPLPKVTEPGVKK